MRKRTAIGLAGLLTCVMAAPSFVSATSVRQLNLDGLTSRADKIFRGTVTSVEAGTVQLGAAELPTTTYLLKVTESFKGDYVVKGDNKYAAITMVGSLKTPQSTGNIVRFDRFRDVPRLRKGETYVLFTTPASHLGLSVTVGLAQGCFDITGTMALNRADNIGLFADTAYAGPARGPLAYDELARRIRASLASN